MLIKIHFTSPVVPILRVYIMGSTSFSFFLSWAFFFVFLFFFVFVGIQETGVSICVGHIVECIRDDQTGENGVGGKQHVERTERIERG